MRKSSLWGTAMAVVLSLSTTYTATAEGNSGAYLAGQHAAHEGDFRSAARYFTTAHQHDRDNPYLIENAIAALAALGDFDQAAELSVTARDLGVSSQIANMVTLTAAAKAGNWDAIFTAIENGQSVGPLVDGLVQAWAFIGKGEAGNAADAFDAVAASPGLRYFGMYHKALGYAVTGDFESAEGVLSLSPEQGMQRTRRSTILRAEVLSHLGRNGEAIQLIDASFGASIDPGLTLLRDALEKGDAVPLSIAADPKEGFAEVFFSVASAVDGEVADSYTLLYTRVAQFMSPNHDEATLKSAELLERLDRFQLASEAYDSVPETSPAFLAAELGRASALREAGDQEEAVVVLQALVEEHNTAMVQASLGDVLRQLGRYDESNEAYTQALALSDENSPSRWFVHYTRGITYERLGQWEQAEADFRTALELEPGQPQVLNYLGYSLVENDSNLDEALDMIRTAAEARPENGSIADSLGWVLYRLGRYDEAVVELERAAELDPMHAVIIDHLGDAYWAVGRKTEAHFMWRRAFSFKPEDDVAARIQDKLEHGLDVVLEREGTTLIRVAHGDSQ
ncbi:tetratricopeptide repeat protein [Pelagovum pacificum]|uniref:Tetratricopeptide repeat protein n=1 Tax=Pelagovum pacificum TaxID=2588711 RepID=A0A5C5GAD8_9RHOB|nr:tetratricopeptide repeat protein [Pelagovum pacificum]QQA42547.1 tetratricopeptide repeat protein [Pelagovum pacificum]TNY31631.1 tetratricopeptide repeat protein [Pelagovum pacificum]